MDITGKLMVIMPTQQVSDRFRKREFVVEYATNPQYPELIKFELSQDRCELIDSFQAGQEVQVFFDLTGRKWTDPQGDDKYFTTIKAWRINLASGSGQEQPPQAGSYSDVPVAPAPTPPAFPPPGDVPPPPEFSAEPLGSDIPF